MTDEAASGPGSESQNRNRRKRFENWLSEQGDKHGLIIGGFMIVGLIVGFVLRECSRGLHDQIVFLVGIFSCGVTVLGLGCSNILQPDKNKHYSVATQVGCAIIAAFFLGVNIVMLFWPSPQ